MVCACSVTLIVSAFGRPKILRICNALFAVMWSITVPFSMAFIFNSDLGTEHLNGSLSCDTCRLAGHIVSTRSESLTEVLSKKSPEGRRVLQLGSPSHWWSFK